MQTPFTVDTYKTKDEVFDKVSKEQDQPYCFAIYFEKFDLANNDYKVQYSFNKNVIPDTNLNSYDEKILPPDTTSWGLWFNSGAITLHMYICEFIARMKTNGETDIGAKDPLYIQ